MMSVFLKAAIWAAEKGVLPDSVTRFGIRRLCEQRLGVQDPEFTAELTEEFLQRMHSSNVAEQAREANHQHYEVPADLFQLMLGPSLKYSSCYWDTDCSTLYDAELCSLKKTCENAGIRNGQRILELGCGWGSLSLYLSAMFPKSEIVAVSNSHGQREYIKDMAASRRLNNLTVITSDINSFEPDSTFDRVVSVEMFEHVRNHATLLERISRWLRPDGKLLVHLFCTAGAPYSFEDEGESDWMARNFFSGGVMPSDDLMLRYQEHLVVDRQWRWSGQHYQRTLEAWLGNLDDNRHRAAEVFRLAGESDPELAIQRWRIFLLACSELFGYARGRQWYVSHYRFAKRPERDALGRSKDLIDRVNGE